jgi:hypothetical protein
MKLEQRVILSLLGLALVTAGCGGPAPIPVGAGGTPATAEPPGPPPSDVSPAEAPPPVEPPDAPPAELPFDLDDPGIVDRPSGLQYIDRVVGLGEAARSGSTVDVHYTGWLTDGTRFDTSRGPGGRPRQVKIDKTNVIQGWHEGLKGMRVGGVRQLIIPPHLAYGENGRGRSIPPDATLVFEILVVAME